MHPPVIGPCQFLPSEELEKAVTSKNKADLIVAGYYDYLAKHLVLFRGDGTFLIASASMFPSDAKCEPDFEQFSLTDYGQTIKLGDYEADSLSLINELTLKKSNAN